jgi:hypothetical protein
MATSPLRALARDVVNTVMRTGDTVTPYSLAKQYGLSVDQARDVVGMAPGMFGPGGKGFDAYVKKTERVIGGKAKTPKLTRQELIEKLAKDLVRREPGMAAHMDDARYRVQHTSPGSVDTLRDLALNARVHDLITEEEYLRAAPDAGYGSAHWHRRERVAEDRRHRQATQTPSLPPGTKRG